MGLNKVSYLKEVVFFNQVGLCVLMTCLGIKKAVNILFFIRIFMFICQCV